MSINELVKERIKVYAAERGVSVSSITEAFYRELLAEDEIRKGRGQA